jgi:hypothetical protein
MGAARELRRRDMQPAHVVAPPVVADQGRDAPRRQIERDMLALQRAAGNQAVSAAVTGAGQSLPQPIRGRLERAWQVSLADVRLHTDADAARLTREQDALAVTRDRDIFIDTAAVNLDRPGGHLVLAHEVAHALQPVDSAGSTGSTAAEGEAHRLAPAALFGRRVPAPVQRRGAAKLLRFTRAERTQISTLEQVIDTARSMALQASHGSHSSINQGELVRRAGGASLRDLAAFGLLTSPGTLAHRYLYTCAAGLVDMRHFYQLAYIANFQDNRYATYEGREHELNAEPTSRFAPEDTPSNALGAFFGGHESYDSVEEFVTHLRQYLSSCHPIDFQALPPADQERVVSFYSDRDGHGVPAHQNETATPHAPLIAACGAAESEFPFEVSPGDPKTILAQKPPYNLTSDGDIRDWLANHPDSALAPLPLAERERLVNRLLDGWISEGDIGGVERLFATASPADHPALAAHVRGRAHELWNEQQRRRLLAAIGP